MLPIITILNILKKNQEGSLNTSAGRGPKGGVLSEGNVLVIRDKERVIQQLRRYYKERDQTAACMRSAAWQQSRRVLTRGFKSFPRQTRRLILGGCRLSSRPSLF